MDEYTYLETLNDGENITDIEISAEKIQTGDYEHYTGDYEVTPLITTQILPTQSKIMDDNVTIWMIPTREEENPQGGITLIIG